MHLIERLSAGSEAQGDKNSGGIKEGERLLEQPVRKAGDGDGRKMGDGVDTHLGVEDRIGGGVKFVQQQKITAFPFSFHCSIQVDKSRGETKRERVVL